MIFPDLDRLFRPQSIMIVGASDRPGSLGQRVVENLLTHSRFEGDVLLVNPRGGTIAGHRCHPTVSDAGRPVDVAVIVIPAVGVLAALRDCARAGTRFAIVLTSGFGEASDEGRRVQDEIGRIASESGMRIIGPNCPGLTNIVDKIGMTFSPAFRNDTASGPLGIATQGGGLGRNLLQAGARGAGAALWASLGNAADLDVPDVINYFTQDDRVSVIVTLLEGVKDGPALVASLLAAARAGKPVVALRVGHSEYGARAVQSHTAAVAGSAAVNSAVFAQYGAVEVGDIDELMDVAWLLSRAMPPALTRVAIWGQSGGALSLAADLVGQAGLSLATFTEKTTRALRAVLPDYAAIANPVDVTTAGMTNPTLVHDSLAIIAADPGVDIVLLPDPVDYGDFSTMTATSIAEVQHECAIPLLPVWMSDNRGPGFDVLAQAGFCSPRSLSKAVDAMRRWADHGRWRATYGTELPPAPLSLTNGSPRAPEMPDVATEPGAKAWLARHGVPVPRGVVVAPGVSAAGKVRGLTPPLVAKIVSSDIAHKSDVGGVRVGVSDAFDEVAVELLEIVSRAAPDAVLDGVLFEEMVAGDLVEMIVGVHRDEVFGTVLTVGVGGSLVELLRDVQSRLLPIDRRIATDMVDGLRLRPLLEGVRGRPARDVGALVEFLLMVSDLAGRYEDAVADIDLNPVVLRPSGAASEAVVALDALVVPRENP